MPVPVHPDRRRTRPNTDPDVESNTALPCLVFGPPGQPDRNAAPAEEAKETSQEGRGEQEKAGTNGMGRSGAPLAVRAPLPELQPQAGHGGGDDGGLPAPVRRGVSPVALHRLGQKYTTSESLITSAFAKTSFGADHHPPPGSSWGHQQRLRGTTSAPGAPLETNDNFRSAFLRYLYRVEGDWFVGGMAAYSNYERCRDRIRSRIRSWTSWAGGFHLGGLGLVVQHDSGTATSSATRGWYLNVNNLAYRGGLGRSGILTSTGSTTGLLEPRDGHVPARLAQSQPVLPPGTDGSYSPSTCVATPQIPPSTCRRWRWRNATSWRIAGPHRLCRGCLPVRRCRERGVLDCGDRDNVYPAWGAGDPVSAQAGGGIVANLEYAMARTTTPASI